MTDLEGKISHLEDQKMELAYENQAGRGQTKALFFFFFFFFFFVQVRLGGSLSVCRSCVFFFFCLCLSPL